MTISVNYDYKIMIRVRIYSFTIIIERGDVFFFSSRIYALILIIHGCWRIPILTTTNDEYFKTIS